MGYFLWDIFYSFFIGFCIQSWLVIQLIESKCSFEMKWLKNEVKQGHRKLQFSMRNNFDWLQNYFKIIRLRAEASVVFSQLIELAFNGYLNIQIWFTILTVFLPSPCKKELNFLKEEKRNLHKIEMQYSRLIEWLKITFKFSHRLSFDVCTFSHLRLRLSSCINYAKGLHKKARHSRRKGKKKSHDSLHFHCLKLAYAQIKSSWTSFTSWSLSSVIDRPTEEKTFSHDANCKDIKLYFLFFKVHITYAK